MTLGLVPRARCGSRVRPTTVVAAGQQRVAERRADEAAGSGDEDLHAASRLTSTVEKVPVSSLKRAMPSRLASSTTASATFGRDVAVEDAGDDVVLGEVVLGDDLGDALGGGELHLLGDAGRAGVEGAAEDAGEGEHVVDLVRVVGAAGGHDPHVGRGVLGHHLGGRVGHREDDRVVVHLAQRLGLDEPGAGEADEEVHALDHVVGPAAELARGSSSPRTSA